MKIKISKEVLKREYQLHYILFIFVFAALDIFTKYLAVLYIEPFSNIKVLGEEFFKLTLIFNTGFVFGLYQDNAIISTVATSLAVIFLFFYRLINEDNGNPWGWNLVMAGAMGNLFDKFLIKIAGVGFRLGFQPKNPGEYIGVVDFLDFDWPDFLLFTRWPSFNLADSCVSVGLVILLFTMKSNENKENKKD